MRVLKPQLLKLVRTQTKKAYTNEEVADVLDTFAGVIREQMLAGNEIVIDGVGKFTHKHTEAHEARNPSTGDTVDVPEHYKPKFGFAQSFTMAMKDVDPAIFQEQGGAEEGDNGEDADNAPEAEPQTPKRASRRR